MQGIIKFLLCNSGGGKIKLKTKKQASKWNFEYKWGMFTLCDIFTRDETEVLRSCFLKRKLKQACVRGRRWNPRSLCWHPWSTTFQMLLISLKVHNEYSSAITPLAVLESLISFGLMHFPMDAGGRRQSITAVMDNRAGNRWQQLELTSMLSNVKVRQDWIWLCGLAHFKERHCLQRFSVGLDFQTLQSLRDAWIENKSLGYLLNNNNSSFWLLCLIQIFPWKQSTVAAFAKSDEAGLKPKSKYK